MRSAQGYILIEILISAAIVAMVLATSISTFYGVSRSLRYAEAADIQIRQARNIVARIRAGVDQASGIEESWEISHQPLTGDNQLVRYKVSHRDQAGLAFSVDVYQGR